MDQQFTIGNLRLMEDNDGYGIMQEIVEGKWEVIASFKYPAEAVKYFAEYVLSLQQHLYLQSGDDNE